MSFKAAICLAGSPWGQKGGLRKHTIFREVPMRFGKGGFLLLLIFPLNGFASGQKTTPTSAIASTSGSFTVTGTPSSSTSSPKTQPKPTYVRTSDRPSADEVNRKVLEERAGSDGGKMLLRSVPNGARILVDGTFVGRTPLLLIVAPGKYRIQMQGEREASGERTVELAAKETKTVAITLTPRYPDRVTAR